MTNFSCWLVQFSKFYLNSIENVWHCNCFVLKFDILYNVNIISFYEVVCKFRVCNLFNFLHAYSVKIGYCLFYE